MSKKDKRKAPAFLLYVDDFIAGTAEMSAEEVGAYIRLLCHQWTHGGVPDSQDRSGRIAGLMGSPSLGYVLAKFSLCEDGMLRNSRLESVRSERDKFVLKQAENGLKGAQKRWSDGQTDGDPNGEPMATPLANGCPENNSPSPSPISNTQGQAVELPSGFPQTEDEAANHADFAGCARDFAITQWRLAAGRGGRDAKDVPIRSWRHYLSGMRAFAVNREAEQKHRNGATKPQPPPNETPQQREKRLLKESL